ncbi:MAG: glycoside hydrolase family 10 protein [Planctomycetota bacterium]
MHPRPWIASLVGFVLLAGGFPWALPGCGHRPRPPITRAIWVTRWDYQSAEDVRRIVTDCAGAGFDTLLFQVRGNGTVFYPSDLEPWAEELGFSDPGFDPLAIACEEAGKRGVALHAWVNAIPGWRGKAPPAIPEQLYNARPEWFPYDREGDREALKPRYYVGLNPCLPEVRNHVAAVCAEIAGSYPVAGIHLDYIRWLEKEEGRDYPRDPRTLALYSKECGREADADRAAWEEWKRDQVTALVRAIRESVREANPRALLTAAVVRTPSIARRRVLQDWLSWLHHGLVDAVFPMQYDRDDRRFAERVRECVAAAGHRPVIMGIGVYLHDDPAQSLEQIRAARLLGCQGISLFAYSSFFRSAAEEDDPARSSEELRRARRERILHRGY